MNRFQETSCSQCGGVFGPGDSGFSHCADHTPKTTRAVFVDGVNKGEVFKRGGRWYWRRGQVAVEPFAKGSKLEDVADWARKCCNGKDAKVTQQRSSR